MKRKKIVGIVMVVVGVVTAVLGIYFWPKKLADPKGAVVEPAALNLEKYDLDSLKKRWADTSVRPYDIKILGPIKAIEDRRKAAKKVYTTKFETREISFLSDGKKVSGMLNRPVVGEGLKPSRTIIMVRGYAEKQGYYPGSGSWAVADKLAEAGFTTISLDFLGYADSDNESTDALESRFHKVVEVMDLIASVKQLPWVDKNNIGIWAHSNGGQIVLSVLEVTGEKLPTVLWAPMTQNFPDSVLSTIDEGSPIKGIIEDFQKHYDARRYAFENYYSWINAPIMIQQGTADEWVKVEWQREVVAKLKELGKRADMIIYKGDDHNLKKNWTMASEENIRWFGGAL